MKKINILAAVLVAMAGRGYAADFTSLQAFKAGDIAAAAESGLPAIPAAGGVQREGLSPGAFGGLETCGFSGVKEDKCVYECESGAIVMQPKPYPSISVFSNGGCAKLIMVPKQREGSAPAARIQDSKITKVENPKYVCLADGGGHAIALNGKSARVWQLDGAAGGAREGLELGDVSVPAYTSSGRLNIAGTLTFFGRSAKIELTLVPDAQHGNKPSMTVKVDGQETPLRNVPCKVMY